MWSHFHCGFDPYLGILDKYEVIFACCLNHLTRWKKRPILNLNDPKNNAMIEIDVISMVNLLKSTSSVWCESTKMDEVEK